MQVAPMKGQRKPGQPQGRIAGAIRNMGSMGAQPRNDARIPPGSRAARRAIPRRAAH